MRPQDDEYPAWYGRESTPSRVVSVFAGWRVPCHFAGRGVPRLANYSRVAEHWTRRKESSLQWCGRECTPPRLVSVFAGWRVPCHFAGRRVPRLASCSHIGEHRTRRKESSLPSAGRRVPRQGKGLAGRRVPCLAVGMESSPSPLPMNGMWITPSSEMRTPSLYPRRGFPRVAGCGLPCL